MNKALKPFLIIISIIFIFVFLIIGLGNAILPLSIAFIISYLFFPVIKKLEQKGISRNLSLISVLSIFCIILLVGLFLIFPSLIKESVSFAKDLPHLISKVILQIKSYLNNFGIHFDLNKEEIKSYIIENISSITTVYLKNFTLTLNKIFGSFLSWILGVLNLFLIPLFLFYLVNDFEKINKEFKELIPRSILPKLTHYFRLTNSVLSGFFRGQLLVVACLMLFYSIGLSLIGLKYSLVIGVITGLISIIPYAGISIGVIISIIVAATHFSSYNQFLLIGVVFILVQLLEGFIITPKLVGDKVGLSAFATLLALIIAGNLFGVMGMLFAIPIAAIFKAILKELILEYKKTKLFKAK